MGITETIVDYALLKAEIAVRDRARRTIVTFIEPIFPGLLAVSLVSTGIFFVLIGMAVFLGELAATALAWEIVGLATIMAGLVTLLIIRR